MTWAQKANKSVPAKGEWRQSIHPHRQRVPKSGTLPCSEASLCEASGQCINGPGTRLKRRTANLAAGKAAKAVNGGDEIIRMMQCTIDSAQRYRM